MINNSTTSTSTVTACDNYSWNGTIYDTSGTYTYTTTNAVGCDSTATLNLTIAVCGCTDALASNYNSLATMDDSSCCYVNITQNDTSICYPTSLCLEASVNQNIGSNNSLSFNGTNNYIDGGNINILEPDYISVGSWFKSVASTGTTQYIVGKSGSNPGYQLGIHYNGNLFFAVGCDGNGSVQASVQATNDNCNQNYFDGKWHFVVGTYDGIDIKIYVDGEFKNSYTLNGGAIGVQILEYALVTGQVIQVILMV